MKLWKIDIFLLDSSGREVEANIFSKVTYNLHPSFAHPTQSKAAACYLEAYALTPAR